MPGASPARAPPEEEQEEEARVPSDTQGLPKLSGI